MKYIVFVIDSGENRATDQEMVEINKFNDFLDSKNYLVTAAGIASNKSTYLIDNRNNLGSILNGSLISGNENYTGFWIMEMPSEEEAKDIAKKASFACNRKVELRPYLN